MDKKLLILFFFLLCSKAYTSSIDSLKIIPNNPTSQDEVMIICKYVLPQSSCKLDSFTFSISNNEINIDADHSMGSAMFPCYNSSDTISLGNLAIGNYTLRYILFAYSGSVFYDSDTANINFTVTENSGIDDKKGVHQNISIYPNPVQTELFIDAIPIGSEYRIINSVGAEVKKGAYEGNSIPVSDFGQGIYFIQIQTSERLYQAKFVKE